MARQAPEIDLRELVSARNPNERSAQEDAIEFLIEAGVRETAQPVADLQEGGDRDGDRREDTAAGSACLRHQSLVWWIHRSVDVRTEGRSRTGQPIWTYHVSSCPARLYLRKHALRAPIWTRGRVRGSGSTRPVLCAAGPGSTATPRTVRGGRRRDRRICVWISDAKSTRPFRWITEPEHKEAARSGAYIVTADQLTDVLQASCRRLLSGSGRPPISMLRPPRG
jgi:hypothetical protein